MSIYGQKKRRRTGKKRDWGEENSWETFSNLTMRKVWIRMRQVEMVRGRGRKERIFKKESKESMND